jgi:hypothetical protein
MQFLSLAAQTNPQTLEQFADLATKNLTQDIGTILLWMVIGQIVVIVSYWISSMMVARENSGFINAIKVWALYIVSFIGVGIATAVLMFILIASKNDSIVGFAILGIALLFLIIIFAVPMKVYDIGFFRAFAFLILVWIIGIIGNVALAFVPGNPQSALVEQFKNLKPEDRGKLVEVLTKRFAVGAAQAATDTLPGEVIAGDRTKTLEERQAALKVMYGELDRRRTALKPDDKAGVARYTSDLARYNNLRTQLSTDASKTP